jgi:hypothetical protein
MPKDDDDEMGDATGLAAGNRRHSKGDELGEGKRRVGFADE